MLKVLVLQKYYGLSNEGTEKEIGDRFSFLVFLELRSGEKTAPKWHLRYENSENSQI